MADVLADASYLVALGYPRDRYHASAKQYAATSRDSLLIPDVALVEAMYNLQRLGGTQAAIAFSRQFVTQPPQLVALTVADFARAIDIMKQYEDTELDFVDCCLTALGERLGISQICTFDHRDFSIIRPKHISHFELLP